MLKTIVERTRYLQFNSKYVRKIFGALYQEGKTYYIPFGPLQGYKLVYDKSINIHSMLGVWELQNLKIWQSILSSSTFTGQKSVICDIGANIGFMSLYFSRYVPNGGVVYAFEPAPNTFDKLNRNLVANKVSNIIALPYACTDTLGKIDFYIGSHHHSSSINANWARGNTEGNDAISVETITLDNFFYENGRTPPNLIKLDIEGGATLALPGCNQLGEKQRPLFMIESHTPLEDRAISDFILQHNYQSFRINNYEWVKDLADTHPNLRGVWGTMVLCPAEKKDALLNIL